MCLAHPSLRGITWWDLCDQGGTPAGDAACVCRFVCDFFDEDEAGGLDVSLVPPLRELKQAELEVASPGDNGICVVCTTPTCGWKPGGDQA